jgi:hypothetical protein
MVNFMRDPTGDLPWEEDATANDVMHVSDAEVGTAAIYSVIVLKRICFRLWRNTSDKSLNL